MPETNPCCLTEKSGGQKAANRTLLWGKRAKELVNSQSPPLVKNAKKVVEVRAKCWVRRESIEDGDICDEEKGGETCTVRASIV
jgi:hypothetical protein